MSELEEQICHQQIQMQFSEECKRKGNKRLHNLELKVMKRREKLLQNLREKELSFWLMLKEMGKYLEVKVMLVKIKF